VVVEGAGSPSDLGTEDIGNYFVPYHHEVATLLVGKISAGGAGASLVGTMEMLPADVRRTVRGFVLNDLIGAEATAMAMARRLEDRLGLPCIGVMPNLWTLAPWGSTEEELHGLAGIVRERLRTDVLFGDEPDRGLTELDGARRSSMQRKEVTR
jgi:adenosylcobyric acid synthase